MSWDQQIKLIKILSRLFLSLKKSSCQAQIIIKTKISPSSLTYKCKHNTLNKKSRTILLQTPQKILMIHHYSLLKSSATNSSSDSTNNTSHHTLRVYLLTYSWDLLPSAQKKEWVQLTKWPWSSSFLFLEFSATGFTLS